MTPCSLQLSQAACASAGKHFYRAEHLEVVSVLDENYAEHFGFTQGEVDSRPGFLQCKLYQR